MTCIECFCYYNTVVHRKYVISVLENSPIVTLSVCAFTNSLFNIQYFHISGIPQYIYMDLEHKLMDH